MFVSLHHHNKKGMTLNKLEEQAYIAGYNGKKRPPWISNIHRGLVAIFKQGQKDKAMVEEIKKRLQNELSKRKNDALTVMKEDGEDGNLKAYYHAMGQVDLSNALISKLDELFTVRFSR